MSNFVDAIARRNLLKFGAIALGSGLVVAASGDNSNANESKSDRAILAKTVDSKMSPDDVLSILMDGNKRFIEQKRLNPNQNFHRITEVAEGQTPFACILSCSDSRVTPEIVFDCGLGDLFVVRDAGNIATPGEIGSLEYGVAVLGAKIIMVMGHENCGAIKAAMDKNALPGSIGSIVAAIQPAFKDLDKRPGNRVENAVKANVELQKERIKKSPVIARSLQENKVKVVGAYYDLNSARVSLISY